jgi:hypothetical protein
MLHISSHTEEKSVSPLIRGLICFLLGLTAAVFLVDTFCLAISDQAESGIEDRIEREERGLEESLHGVLLFATRHEFDLWRFLTQNASLCIPSLLKSGESVHGDGWRLPLRI